MCTLFNVFHYRNVKLFQTFDIAPGVIDFYDLTMVLSGELSYWVNEKQIILQAGDIMFLPPGTLRARDLGNQEVHYVSFNFLTDRHLDLPILMKNAVTPEIRALFLAFTPSHLSLTERGKEKAAHIAGYIVETLTVANQQVKHNPHIQKAIKYINEHISEAISLSDLAAHLHLSREYTATLFKKETGMSVSAFIIEKKLLLARDLIRDNEYPLSHIARSLGYENYGYFSRLYKKRFGVSPSHFQS